MSSAAARGAHRKLLFLTPTSPTPDTLIGAEARTKSCIDASHGVSQRQQCLQEIMQTHHVSVLPLQKPRQRDPVPHLPRLHPRHPHWGGTFSAPEEGPQPPDDRGIPGQQQEAVQQGRPGVSVQISSPPPCPLKELPGHSAPGCTRKHFVILHTPSPLLFRNSTTASPYLASHISQLCVSPFISSVLSFQSLLRRPVVT